MSDNIKVAIKVRPLITRERDENLLIQWKVHENTLTPVNENSIETFSFDHVFDTTSHNEEIYSAVVKPIANAAVNGFNGTIFAYGQTSSGKTYTMIGSQNEPGVIELAVNDIFQCIQKQTDRVFLIRASYIEIYNEKLHDLLDKSKGNSKIKVSEDAHGNVSLNAKEEITNTPANLLDVMRKGNKNRQTGQTNMNEHSSRSHTIFRIIIESKLTSEPEGAVQVSHLNLVDLAGSERSSQTGATGVRLREGNYINLSLFTLSCVIKQLSEQTDPKTHINFRNSKLTRILQSSLGGNAKTVIICAITPAAFEESISTLQFAARAKSIKNKPKVNEVISNDVLLKRYAKQIEHLRVELEKERTNKENLQSEENQKLQERIALLEKFILKPAALQSCEPNVPVYMKDLGNRRQTWGGAGKFIPPGSNFFKSTQNTIEHFKREYNAAPELLCPTPTNAALKHFKRAYSKSRSELNNSFVSGDAFFDFDLDNSILIRDENSTVQNESIPMENFEIEIIEQMRDKLTEMDQKKMKEDMDALKRQIKLLEQENKEIQEFHYNERSTMESAVEMLEKENSHLKMENIKLNQTIAANTKLIENLKTSTQKSQVCPSCQNVTNYTDDLTNCAITINSIAQEKIKEFLQNKESQFYIEKLISYIPTTLQILDTNHKALTSMRAINIQTKNKLKDMKMRSKQKVSLDPVQENVEDVSMEADLEDMKCIIVDVISEIQKLEVEITDLKNEKQKAQKDLMNERTHSTSTINNLNTTIETLRKKQSELENDKQQNIKDWEDLFSKSRQAERQIAFLKGQNATFQLDHDSKSELLEVNKKLDSKIREMELTKFKMMTTNDELEQKVTILQKELENVNMKAKFKFEDDLKQIHSLLKKKIDEKSSDIDNFKSELEVKLVNKLNIIEKLVQSIENLSVKLKLNYRYTQDLEQQIVNLEENLSKLRTDFDHANMKLDMEIKKSTELEDNRSYLKQKIESINQQMIGLENNRTELEAELKRVQELHQVCNDVRPNDEVQLQLTTINSELEQKNKKLEQANAQVKKLEESYSLLNTELTLLNSKYELQIRIIEELKQVRSHLEDNCQLEAKKLEEALKNNEKLIRNTELHLNDLECKTEQISQLQVVIANLKLEQEKTVATTSKQVIELEQTTNRITELEAENVILKTKLQEIEELDQKSVKLNLQLEQKIKTIEELEQKMQNIQKTERINLELLNNIKELEERVANLNLKLKLTLERNSELENKILKDLNEENAALKAELSRVLQLEESNSKLQEHIVDLNSKLELIMKKNCQLEQNIDLVQNLQKQNEDLKIELSRVTEMKQNNLNILNVNNELKDKIEYIAQVEETVKQKQSQLELLQESYFKEQNRNQELKENLIRSDLELANQIQELRNEVGSLEIEKLDLEQQVNKLKLELESKQNEIQKLTSQSNSLDKPDILSTLETEISELNALNNNLKLDLDSCELRCQEYETQNLKLITLVDSLQNEIENVTENQKIKVSMMEDSNDNLVAQLENTKLELEYSKLQTKNENLLQKIQKLETESLTSKTKLTKSHEDMVTKTRELESEILKLEQINSDLLSKLKDSESNLKSEINKSDLLVKEVKEKIEEVESENVKRIIHLESSIQQLRHENAKLASCNETIQLEYKNLESQIIVSESLLKQLQVDNTELSNQLNDSKSYNSVLESEVLKVKDSNKSLQCHLTELNSKVIKFEISSKEMKNEINELEHKLSITETEKQKFETQIANLEISNQSLLREINNLGVKLSQENSLQRQLENNISNLENTNKNLLLQIQELESKITTSQLQSKELETQISELSNKITQYESSKLQLDTEISQLKEVNQNLQSQISKSDQMKREIDELQTKLKNSKLELETKLSELKNSNEVSQSQVRNLNSELVELRAKLSKIEELLKRKTEELTTLQQKYEKKREKEIENEKLYAAKEKQRLELKLRERTLMENEILLQEYKQKCDMLTTKEKTLNVKLLELESKIAALESDNKKIKENGLDLHTLKKSVDNHIENVMKACNCGENNLKALDSFELQLSKVQTELQKQIQNCKSKEIELKEMQRMYQKEKEGKEALKSDLSEKNAMIRMLDEEVKKQSAEFEQLSIELNNKKTFTENSFEELKSKISDLEDSKKTLELRNSQLETQLQHQQELHSSLKSQLGKLEAELQTQQKVAGESINKLRSKIVDLEQTKTMLEVQKAEIETQLEHQHERRASLENHLGKLETQLELKLESAQSEANSKAHVNLTNLIGEQSSKLKAQKLEINKLNSEIKKKCIAIAQMKAEMSKAENESKAEKQESVYELRKIRNEYTTLRSNYELMVGEISGLRAETKRLELENTELQKELRLANLKTSQHTSAFQLNSKLEEDVKTLKIQLQREQQQSSWIREENSINLLKIHELEECLQKLKPSRSEPTNDQKNRRLSSSKRNLVFDGARKLDEVEDDKKIPEIVSGSGTVTIFYKDEEIRHLKQKVKELESRVMSYRNIIHTLKKRTKELEDYLNLAPSDPVPKLEKR